MSYIRPQAVANWLKTCTNVIDTKPVVVTIGKIILEGGMYTLQETYQATERAVTEKIVKAGETYLDHRFYLLGNSNKNASGEFKHNNRVFVWTHDLPMDMRTHYSIGEWYVMCYSADGSLKEPFIKYHPFGHNLILGESKPFAYGTYKDQKIDHYERSAYQRIPMRVEFLTPA